MKAALILAIALPLMTAQDPFATQACVAAADAAARAGKAEEARGLLVSGLTKDPNSSRLLGRLLNLDLKQGRKDQAEVWASRLLDLGVDPGLPEPGSDLLRRVEALSRSEGRAEVAAVLPEAGLLIEGIAQGLRPGETFLAAVNRRAILRRTAMGRLEPFAQLQGWTPLALAVDARRHLLWAAGCSLEQMEGFDAKGPRHGRIAAFDLRTGRRVQEVELEPSPTRPRMPGDLLLHADGTVLISDSAGALWRLRPGASKAELYVAEGRLVSPQGMAWLPGGDLLLADYALGLLRVDPQGGLHPLVAPPNTCLLGIDGLVTWKGGFYSTQNGVGPARLWRLEVSGDHVNARTLLRAHPAFGEPTLMAAGPQGLLLVANAQWERFGPGGAVKGSTERVVLLKISPK